MLYMMTQKQHLAYFGDKNAARHLILPCYKPLIRGICVAFIILVLLVLIVYSVTSDAYINGHIVEYCAMCCMILYCIPIVLLLQPSVSLSGFRRTLYLLFPWWLFCTLIWSIWTAVKFYPLVWSVLFILSTAAPPTVYGVGIITGLIPSRVRLGSRSNRSCVEFLLVYCVFYTILMCLSASYTVRRHAPGGRFFGSVVGLATCIFLSSQIFPLALYRTLLADTKFWRGLGKHNKGGIVFSNGQEHDKALPGLTTKVAAKEFQGLLADVKDWFIDFAFVKVGPLVGSGASADVYKGSLRQTDVAIKVSTPPEVTADELLRIRNEALLNSNLCHPCIVKFYGICIRPPQIGLVVEYCDHGNMKQSLERDAAEWTPVRRLRAIHDAARAVAYLHSKGFMHRDIKAENLFVTYKWNVKLGDFGESTVIREKAVVDENGGRMTVLGTVAYMAPELVSSKSFYTEAVDVYALAVTIWQIWTGRDPFDGCDTFTLYDMIVSGIRPDLPIGAPEGLVEAITKGWSDEESRASSEQMVDMLSEVVRLYSSAHDIPVNESRKDSKEGADTGLLLLGNSSFVEDCLVDDAENGESGLGFLSPLHSVYTKENYTDISGIRLSPRREKSGDSPRDRSGSTNDDKGLLSPSEELSIDLSGYGDEDLYQSYGRKSTTDIKRNPLIPSFSNILTNSSPMKNKRSKWLS